MTFESKVMATVEDTIGTSKLNGFFNGTLFVTCSATEARSLFTTLNKQFGPVEITPQRDHSEYAFDFTE